jgi:hypothetical protein
MKAKSPKSERTPRALDARSSVLLDDAMAGLSGVLSEADLETIRVVLREALQSDPVLVLLARAGERSRTVVMRKDACPSVPPAGGASESRGPRSA